MRRGNVAGRPVHFGRDVTPANPTIWAPSTSQEGHRLAHGLVSEAASTSELVADVAQQRATRRDVVRALDPDRR